ncbi:hypothetical protein G5I_01269 [Acromyrmex echinatior]|uniref:Uncharacterized protein n=1 Tax=Acromyrmex echinatior TaxID=103372 RepID=F4W760_ACREC|nr:hypothetical protein G5I_01269 [Acromyrmex echinatior]
MNERAEGALTRWTERGPWVSDYAGAQAPSGTSTRPRKGSHAVSGPLSIRLNPWGRTYGIRQRGDANVTSLRQITILLWDKRRSQLKCRVVNRILQNAKIDTPQT